MMIKYAFFDVDETVIRFKSMFLFHEYYCKNVGPTSGLIGGIRHRNFIRKVRNHLQRGRSREFINALYYRDFKGRKHETVKHMVREWYRDLIGRESSIFVLPVLDIIRRHKESGSKIILVSGSFMELLEPIGEEIGADRVLATQLEVIHGRYTGRIIPPQMIGAGKAVAVRTLIAAEGGDRENSWAYGDHTSDIAMLEEVGHPTIVSRDQHMIDIATERGWNIVDPLSMSRETSYA